MKIGNLIKSLISKSKRISQVSGGKIGEKLACKFLKKHGYKIERKNFRCRYGEIDIIAKDKNTLCFIEVKARSTVSYGFPEEFVDSRKRKKLFKTATTYITKQQIEETDMRFDIVAVDLKEKKCRLLKNAFELDQL